MVVSGWYERAVNEERRDVMGIEAAAELDVFGAASGLGSIAGIASTLSKLGLKPEQIAKLAPTLIKAVQSKGGAEIAGILAGALK